VKKPPAFASPDKENLSCLFDRRQLGHFGILPWKTLLPAPNRFLGPLVILIYSLYLRSLSI